MIYLTISDLIEAIEELIIEDVLSEDERLTRKALEKIIERAYLIAEEDNNIIKAIKEVCEEYGATLVVPKGEIK